MSRDSAFSAAINTYIKLKLFYACDAAKKKKVESREVFRLVGIRLNPLWGKDALQ